MKTGRNAPCPCGSGRKYKHCCLPKEQAAARARQSDQQKPVPPAETTPESDAAILDKTESMIESQSDPQIEAFNARWDEFEAADYEGKIALFFQTLEEPELMDSEMAFEMLSRLHHESVERQQRQRFDEWVSALRTGAPEAYEENAAYLIDWQIGNALASGAYAALPALVREFSGEADTKPDAYQVLLDKLAYHGQTALLLDAIEFGWPQVKDSTNLFEWAIDDFARQAVEFTVLDHIERHPDGSGDEAALIQRLGEYTGADEVDDEVDLERLKHYLILVYGRDERVWNGDDFVPDNKERVEHLYELSAAFLGYLQRVEPAPLSRGELARKALLRYLSERYDKPKRSSKHRKANAAAALCPERASLDRFLAELLGFLSTQYYRAVSLFELIPAWLRFLQSVNLIDASAADNTLQRLMPLRDSLLTMCQKRFDDPALEQALAAWPDNNPT